MTAPAVAMPESTYEVLVSAARTWPDPVATQWFKLALVADAARHAVVEALDRAGPGEREQLR